jgi:PAS domain S-box-containing protein
VLLVGLVIAVLMHVVTRAQARAHAATEAIAGDLRRSEEALRESDERTRLTLAQALDAVITGDTEGRITGWNRQAETVFGWTREEVIGRRISETVIPSAARDAHERGLAHYLATGEGPVLNRRIEVTALRRDGTEFPAELAITPTRMAGVTVFTAFLRDITERVRAEDIRRQSEESFRLLFAGNPAAMWVYDVATLRFLEVNGAAIKHYGYSRDEFLRMRLTDIRPPEEVPRLEAFVAELTATTADSVPRQSGTWKHRLKDGRIRDVDVVADTIEFEGRRAAFVVVTDVTELRQTQASLAKFTARLEMLHEIDRAIIALEEPAAIAEAVLWRLRDLLEVPRAIVNLFDLEAGEAEWLAAVGRRRIHLGPGVRFPITLMGDVEALRKGHLQVIDVRSLPESAQTQALLASGVYTYMVVPMIAGGDLIGAISFGGAPGEFPPDQISIAQEVAAQLAIAIAQARLRERVTRQAARLGLLHEMDRSIIAAETPSAMAAAVLPRLRDLLGVTRAIVNLFDLESGEVEWLAAAGRRRVRVGPGIRYSLRLAGDVDALRRGEPQAVDVDSLPPSAEVDALRASGIHSYMVVPMIATGELIGSLSFGGASAEFSPEQVSIAQEVAAQLALAIAQARLRERVAEAEQQYRKIFENSVEGIFRSTRSGRLVLVNPAMARIYGHASPADLLAPETGADRHLCADPEQWQALLERLDKHGAVSRFECRGKRKDGTVIWVSVSLRAVRDDHDEILYYEGVLEDITELKQLGQELLHHQKMEGFGQLAAGIAHDFNNLLTIITGRSELAAARLEPADALHRDLAIIHKTADRASALTRQLLAFSRRQILQPKIVALNELVVAATDLLRRLIGENIELTFVPGADLGRVRVDPGQLEQVIVNLAVNARDAMPEGGQLTVQTANVEFDEGHAVHHVDVVPGRYVMLAVTDTGTGMTPELQARIFEPFFTTKAPGKGTGLGLATVYGIVKQSGGHLRVYSEPGAGTTFKIYFPHTDEAPDARPAKPREAPRRGTETILLVEDEAEVRSLAQEALERFGYTVLAAALPTDAMLIAERHVGTIDLLLTDVVMPRMSGRALAEAVTTTRPGIKVLFTSGYTDDAIVRHGVLEAGIQFLEKPFTPPVLGAKVREVLDQDRPARD